MLYPHLGSSHKIIMGSLSNEVAIDLSPALKIFKDGRIERLWITPTVPPSPEDPTTGISSKDIIVSHNVSARLYLPNQVILENQETKLPIFVYYHGGGFCAESPFEELEHNYMNIVTSQANVLAVAVCYRLAPEYPLPAAYEDSWSALQWVASNVDSGQDFGIQKDPWLVNHGDFGKIILGGDSAGANIVHNIALRAGQEKLPGDVKIYSAVLSFPYFWGSKPSGDMSVETLKQSLEYRLWEIVYPSAPGGIDDPMINPMAENAPSLKGLPLQKIFVCTAEKDELRERAILYVEAVKKSGWKGKIELVDVEGETHCFQVNDPSTSKAKELIKKFVAFILE